MIRGIKLKKINLFNAPGCSGMIRKLNTGEYRLYLKKKTGKMITGRSIGTYSSLAVAKRHEQQIE
jgi:hypothetical protein